LALKIFSFLIRKFDQEIPICSNENTLKAQPAQDEWDNSLINQVIKAIGLFLCTRYIQTAKIRPNDSFFINKLRLKQRLSKGIPKTLTNYF
jgi:hypothetical protein